MHTLLLQNLQQLGGFASKGFTESERNLHLNVGLHRYIKQRYTGNNPRKVSVEGDLKRTADLSGLVTIKDGLVSVTNTTHVANADIFTLPGYETPTPNPNKFMLYMYSQSAFHLGGGDTFKWIGNRLVAHNDLHKYIANHANDPVIEEPLVLFISGKIMIIRGPNDTVTDVELFYIEQPTAITSGSSEYVGMPEHTHEEIVELTSAILMGRTERKGYAISQEELKQTE